MRPALASNPHWSVKLATESTDVVFELPDPAYEQYTWEPNEHMSASVAPLPATVDPVPTDDDGFPYRVRVNGYLFARPGQPLPFVPLEPETVDDILGWSEEWVPQVEAVAAEYERFDPSTVAVGQWRSTIEAQQAEFQRVFLGVHRRAVGQSLRSAAQFTRRFSQHFGEDRAADGFALLQGIPNLTNDRIDELWALSRILHEHPSLVDQLRAGTDLPAISGDGADAVQRGLRALLERFGHTTQARLEDLPSWNEDPSQIVDLLLTFAGVADADSLLAVEERGVRHRKELQAQLRAAAESEGGEAAELLELLPLAQTLVPATENHNLLADQRMYAASRQRWLRIGEHLQGRGALDDAENVFYLTFDELLETLEGGDAPAVTEFEARHASQVAWRSAVPPSSLGAVPEGIDVEPEQLTGLAASGGQYRGVARVASSVEDAQRLEQGEVLICVASSPEWTPLFAIAGAVVTDTGGMLTHCAIVAREYGIPAVVGTRFATRDIVDGAIVTVDGSAGTVTVEG